MNINFQAKNLEITGAIHDYVIKRLTNLGKLLMNIETKGGNVKVQFDIAKTTNHHKGGEFFRADCSIIISGKKFYASADKEDLYDAIDTVKEMLLGEISKDKDKKQTLFHRGARKIKDTIKGIKNWKK